MSATEELRRMLDERGVEWKQIAWSSGAAIWWRGRDGVLWRAHDNDEDELLSLYAMNSVTPAQAVEATLGPAGRHPKPHEQWTTVLLPEIAWDWDGRWPDYLSVAHDVHGEWRVYVPEATLGRGTCQVETTENWLPAERYHRCKECGAFFAVLDASHDIPPRYCPNCGAEVVS